MLQKFNGRNHEDYNLWRRRAVIALKCRDLWRPLQEENCSVDIKYKAAALLVGSLGDQPYRVCQYSDDDPMKMLKLLDKRYALTRSVGMMGVFGQLYYKRYDNKMPMSKFIDEFTHLFALLESFGDECKVPESHKVPLLILSLGINSKFESTVAAYRMKNGDEATWGAVTSDLIQEDLLKKSKRVKTRTEQ